MLIIKTDLCSICMIFRYLYNKYTYWKNIWVIYYNGKSNLYIRFLHIDIINIYNLNKSEIIFNIVKIYLCIKQFEIYIL